MSTMQVVGPDGNPVTSIRPDQPVEIHVDFPPGSALPNSIDVTVLTGAGDSTVVTLKQQSGTNTFTSGPIHIGHGVAEGYGIGKGALARLDISNGEGVRLDGGSWGSSLVTWYPDELQQAIGEGESALVGIQSYLMQVQISLLHAPASPEVDTARGIAKQKYDFITNVRAMLNNDQIWPRSKMYLAKTAIQNVLRPGYMDLVEVYREINNAIDQGKQEGQAIVLSGLVDLTKVFYEQYTSATGASAMWTLMFGQDIYGKEVTGKERLMAAAEIGVNALMTVLPILHMRSMTVPGTTPRIPRAIPEIPRPIEGVVPKGAPAGVRATAEEYGMLREGAAHANTVASNNEAIIQVRPTNRSAMKWRKLGHPGKPMELKSKTINDLDVHLGAREDDIGLVGYFKPKEPVRPAGMTDKQWQEVQTRYNDRLQEFGDNAVKMDHLIHEGKIRVDEHGVVIDTGICGGTGKGITGDYDLWRITKLDGTPFSAIDEELIVNQLRFGAYGAQHGAHTSWKIDPNAPMYQADPALLRGHQKVDADIRAKHQLGADKAEAVIEFGGVNRPPVTAYEGTGTPGAVTAPGPAPTGTPVRVPGAGPGRKVLVGAGAGVIVIGAGIGIAVGQGGSSQKAPETTPAASSAAVNSSAAGTAPAPPTSGSSPATGSSAAGGTGAGAPAAETPAAAPVEAAPVLTPISAVFIQSEFSTFYTERAQAGSDATYSWSVSIPADPPCGSGFKGGDQGPNHASWFHADVTNSPPGPCNHNGADYGLRGHPGIVSLVVTTAHWSCTATYDGTITGTGNAPLPCTRR